MYKLVAMDCDGTLLNEQKRITDRTNKVIKEVKKQNVHIVLASARPFYRILPYIRELGLDTADNYTIAFNGALVLNNTESNIIIDEPISDILVRKVVEYCKSTKKQFYIYTYDKLFALEDRFNYLKISPDANFYIMKEGDFPSERIYKIVIRDTLENIGAIEIEVKNLFSEQLNISKCDDNGIVLISKNVSKTIALEAIIKMLKVKPNEVIAFGDEENDIDMLDYVGLSVSMKNASDQVKSHTLCITESNNNDGIAVFLEDTFLDSNQYDRRSLN